MPKIPHITQRVREQFVPTVPAEAEIAEAVGGLAQKAAKVTQELYEDIQMNRYHEQFTEAQLSTLEQFSDLILKFETDTDYATQVERYKKSKEEIKNKVSEKLTGPVLDDYTQWFRGEAIDWDKKIELQAQELEIKADRANTPAEVQRAINLGDKDMVSEILRRKVAGGIFYAHEVVEMEQEAHHDIDYQDAQMGVMRNGITWLYSKDAPDLPLNEREEIQKWYEEKMKVIEDALKKEREAEVKAINEDLVNRYAALLRGEGTPRDFIDYVNQTTLDPTGPYSKQWWNENAMKLVEEPKGRYEITDPEIEAKVAQYVRRTDKTTEQKANYINKYYGQGLGTTEYNKYMDKIGWPPEKKKTVGKGPSEISNPELEIEITRDIADPKKDKLETAKKILENIGPDDEGNPRLDPKTAKTLLNWNESYKNDPGFSTAMNRFEKAFDDGYITAKEMVSGMKDFEIKASSGKYTTPGLVQESENMVALMNEEYIANKLERYREPGELFKHKETVEEYIARHPPETKTLPSFEEGNITDFATWKNVPDWWISVKTIYLDSGIEAHTDDNGLTWYMKIKGKWYVADPKANTLVPYKKGR